MEHQNIRKKHAFRRNLPVIFLLKSHPQAIVWQVRPSVQTYIF